MKRVLLHICCGVCALYCIEKLSGDGFLVEGFFFNPNIHPYSEYLKRKQAAETVAKSLGIVMEEGSYLIFDWLKLSEPYSQDPEGGRRCIVCYKMRLEQTKLLCDEKNYDYFTTTLTVSPHKPSKIILDIGRSIDKVKFLALDFEKDDGFQKTIQEAKKLNLYRQNYCGCIYSKS